MFKNKKLPKILALLMSIFLLIIFFPYGKAEFLTYKYGEQFQKLYKQTGMISEIEYLKVVEYNSDLAKVCYITQNHQSLNVLIFENSNNTWMLSTWETVWSKSGSAEGFIWPYYF